MTRLGKYAGLLVAGAGCAAGIGFAGIAELSGRVARLSAAAEDHAFRVVAKGTVWAAAARGSQHKEREP